MLPARGGSAAHINARVNNILKQCGQIETPAREVNGALHMQDEASGYGRLSTEDDKYINRRMSLLIDEG
jgi:hypothetical protein